MKGWYWSAVDHTPPPAWVNLKWITSEIVDLYRYLPPLGENIPVSVEPFPVEDLVPMEDDIKWAVKRLRNHQSWGPQGNGMSTSKSGWQRREKRRRRQRKQ